MRRDSEHKAAAFIELCNKFAVQHELRHRAEPAATDRIAPTLNGIDDPIRDSLPKAAPRPNRAQRRQHTRGKAQLSHG